MQEAADAVRSTLSRIAEVEAKMATATDMCASNKMDLGSMAESLGAAFQQVHKCKSNCYTKICARLLPPWVASRVRDSVCKAHKSCDQKLMLSSQPGIVSRVTYFVHSHGSWLLNHDS